MDQIGGAILHDILGLWTLCSVSNVILPDILGLWPLCSVSHAILRHTGALTTVLC